MQKWRKLLRGPFSQLFLPDKGITILFSLVDKQKASVGVVDSTSNTPAFPSMNKGPVHTNAFSKVCAFISLKTQ